MTILADHKKLIYSGRIDWSNPLEPIFVFPCKNEIYRKRFESSCEEP